MRKPRKISVIESDIDKATESKKKLDDKIKNLKKELKYAKDCEINEKLQSLSEDKITALLEIVSNKSEEELKEIIEISK